MPGFNNQSAPPTFPPDYNTGPGPAATGNFNTVSSDSQRLAVVSSAPSGFTSSHPAVPSAVMEYFLPARMNSQQAIAEWQQRTNFSAQAVNGATLAYRPVLLAQTAVRYQDRKANIFTARYYAYRIPDIARAGLVHWEDYLSDPLDPKTLLKDTQGAAIYADLAPGLSDAKRMSALQKELVDMLYNTARLRLLHNPLLKLYSNPDVADSEFYAQAAQIAREQRDAEIDKVTTQFEKQIDTLEDRMTRKERELHAERKELADRRREQAFTTGEAFLSLLRGRTTYTLSRTSRARRYTRQTEEDLVESEQVLRDLSGEMDALEQRFEQELAAVNDKWAKIANDIQEYLVTPYKKDIQVELFGVGWLPHWYTNINNQALLLPAY